MQRDAAPAHDLDARPGHSDDIERAVLGCVADLHPIQLTLPEVVRELTGTPNDFASCDRIAIGVQQLVRAGLLHRHAQFVLPTRALMRARELDW